MKEMIRKLEDIEGKLTAPEEEKYIGKRNEFKEKEREKVPCRPSFTANNISDFSRFALDESQPLGIDQPGGLEFVRRAMIGG